MLKVKDLMNPKPHIRRCFLDLAATRNNPLNPELMFETDCDILLLLGKHCPPSSLPLSVTMMCELLDPVWSDLLARPQDYMQNSCAI